MNACDYLSRYYLQVYMRDNLRPKIAPNPKPKNQVEFETYLRSIGILVVDYARTLKDINYFNTLNRVMNINPDKKICLYSSYQLYYQYETRVFEAHCIPSKPDEKIFQNIWDYLSNSSKSENMAYYCVHCGIGLCLTCGNERIHAYSYKDWDYHYLICPCGKSTLIYKLPANYTI